ncbi:RraA family protein [Galbitalea sp. SE-J8]|uniref:RraA family protein n=1 Tax=Galbitalea sp. SE-J8 TaxID=3054952 RepID=UPI00259CA90B|nr:RraA family protein [Galbitalea sp. SE-J8]MDM4764125.1 RraA family protein [Galbitalea sp. SE-J8]
MSDAASVPALPTAAIADAALRLGVPVGHAPAALTPVLPGRTFAGVAAPVTHLGSVDVILEAIDDAPAGAVLVVDNGGRDDEACVGDLLVLEAERAGLAGIVVWGRHRDTAQLREIGLPVHSVGARSTGPLRVPPAGRALRTAVLDGVVVTDAHVVFADDDGVLVARAASVDDLVGAARAIVATEAAQAERMRSGTSLREQLDFAGYRAAQASDPALTLRAHLAARGGAIEV